MKDYMYDLLTDYIGDLWNSFEDFFANMKNDGVIPPDIDTWALSDSLVQSIQNSDEKKRSKVVSLLLECMENEVKDRIQEKIDKDELIEREEVEKIETILECPICVDGHFEMFLGELKCGVCGSVFKISEKRHEL